MQLIRTLVWVLLAIFVVVFVIFNSALTGSESVPIRFWPLNNGTWFRLEWPVGIIVLVSMALGFLPMWLLHKGARWRLNRRINFLENTVKSSSQGAPTVVATTTQLEQAAQEQPTSSL